MIPDKTMIKHLNTILGNELVAINQYFLHSKLMADQGFEKLSNVTRAESIDEMNHADWLSNRILELKGFPNLQDLGKLSIGESIPEMLKVDMKLEEKALGDLRQAIEYAESMKDFGTRDLLTRILKSEEEHYDFLDRQLTLIDQIGVQNYLQSQV